MTSLHGTKNSQTENDVIHTQGHLLTKPRPIIIRQSDAWSVSFLGNIGPINTGQTIKSYMIAGSKVGLPALKLSSQLSTEENKKYIILAHNFSEGVHTSLLPVHVEQNG